MDRDPSPRFSLLLLGRFKLSGPDGVVDLPGKKLAALLAYLACTAPRPQRRETLSALLWGSHFDLQAKQNLRQSLFRLRKMLGQDALEGDGEVVSLNPAAVSSDVGRFEALVREGSRDALTAAAELYRGPLVDDVAVGEEGWSEWLTVERQRLLELALGAMVRLGEQELAAGRAEHALRAGQRAIAFNSMREDAHRLILRALTTAGRKAEALTHYQDLVALLKRELNAEPDAATRSLAGDLRSAKPPTVREIAERRLDIRDNAKHALNAEKLATRSDASSPAGPARSAGSERRQLTIMACTMVGAPLAASLDPEDLRDRIGAFRKAVADVAARFDGLVAQYQGNGVLVYFGYPAAHEHDAEQAVRAGLEIVSPVGMLKTGFDSPPQASAGIATGLVVIGEQVGTGEAGQRIAIGEAPTLAARLQTLAAPGKVIVAASTRRLVGRMFDCRVLAADELDGLPPSVEAWQVRGEMAGIGRFEARRAATLTQLVGRQEEMELLLRRWDQAKLGEGRVVLLSAEPGIGKSRIAESLLARLEGEPHTRLRYFCSPHHTHSPLYPTITQLERAAGFEPGSSANAKLDRLEALLKPAARNVSRDVALIAELLGVPMDGRYPALAVSPQQKREMTLTALLDQLDGVAARSPVLIVFEDTHWIDPTSLDLLDRTVARAANLPVLLVVMFRPEFQPTWVGEPHVTMLPLSRLGRRDSAAMIGGVTRGKSLPDAVLERVLAQSDGVPLFIEELTKTVLESGLLDAAGDRYVMRGALPAFAIPSTLHASLLARLDRLTGVKDVAQTAAAIGREFSYALIAAVVEVPERALRDALAQLVGAELIFQRGLPPDSSYLFKHALVQDAVYASLVRSRRRQLHADIAHVLEAQFADVAASEPEVLAHHFTAAGLGERGVLYWQRAGEQASDRSANLEATGHFNAAIELLKTLPDTPARTRQQSALYVALGAALIVVKGDASAEVEHAYLKARELCERIGNTPELVRVLFGLWRFYITRGQLQTARELGETLLRLANNADDPALAVIAHYAVGFSRYKLGELPVARQHFEDGIAKYAPEQRHAPVFRIGQDPGVACRSFSAMCHWLLGFPDQALARGQDALALAYELSHPHSVGFAQCWLAFVYQFRRDLGAVREQAEAALAIATEQGSPVWAAMATIFRGWALAMQDRREEHLADIKRGIAAWQATGATSTVRYFRTLLAEASDLLGHPEDALQQLADAQTMREQQEDRWWEAEIYRLRGAMLLRHSMAPQAETETWFRRALDVAHSLQAKSLELRAATSLARLWHDQGKHAEARNLLAPIYSWFTEGFETPDLKEATDLLGELR
jgi:class 3 adenylate cyclase/predicted ATPase